MDNLRFARERAHDLIEEIKPLLERHWEEIAHYKDIPLNPDYDFYRLLEDSDSLRCFTVRNSDLAGQLVGYAIYLCKTNIHYRTSRQAVQDILFLSPEYRGGRAGLAFIDWYDDQLRAEGVQAVYQHVKTTHNFGPVLERVGYELVDLIYAKRLDLKPKGEVA